jgi:hypothetical protein
MLTRRVIADRPADERGAVMVITVLVMTILIGVAAYALDTSIWFVHHDHLQTEADAAALAAGQALQCNPGTANATVDSAVVAAVHQYDGTGVTAAPASYAGSTPINSQVWASPVYSATYSNKSHNLFSQVNQPNFENQASPNDSGMSGSPCKDGSVDVKLTETNLPSVIPFLNPSYINAQARVTLMGLSTSAGAEPFAEPLPTPAQMSATLVDESNGDAAIAPAVSLTPSPDHTVWTGTALNVTFANTGSGTFPVGLRISQSGGATATCGTAGVDTYENDGSCTSGHGITLTRVWANSGTPGQPTSTPVAPQTNDVTVSQVGVGACPTGPTGVFSTFISSSTSCTVQVSATNVVFATGTGAPAITCSNASLTLTVGTAAPVSVPCPSGTPLNGKTWTSNPITISPNAGLINLTLNWTLTAGNLPVGGSGGGGNPKTCSSSKPCTGTLASQRVNSGAYDSTSSATSLSGGIVGANLVDASTGTELISVARGYKTSVNITVQVLGFSNTTNISSPPIELTFGGNQANAALECAGSSMGNPQLLAAIATGCQTTFQTTTGSCPNSMNPPSCVRENPGSKLSNELDDGMNERINGSPTASCVNWSHWVTPNTVTDLRSESPPDPRLLLLMVTDYGALTNGANWVPIRAFATFYVTGWANDPCSNHALTPVPSGGLASTWDDSTTDPGVLLGHFIQYTVIGGSSTGFSCTGVSFGDCTPVLTK